MDNDDRPSINIGDHNQKKMMHRDIEKKRRQDMAALYALLRSTLPPPPHSSIKQGKRSLADHMNDAVNHIKHLQTRIKQLCAQRDGLKSGLHLTSTSSCPPGLAAPGNIPSGSCSSSSRSSVAVNPCLGGVEVVIISELEQQGLQGPVVLSRVLQVLLEQGLTVINCATTQVNKRLVYTIRSEVSNPSSIDFPGLDLTLNKVISHHHHHHHHRSSSTGP